MNNNNVTAGFAQGLLALTATGVCVLFLNFAMVV
jgi:hypothetical protein